jgi:hypothetical protein
MGIGIGRPLNRAAQKMREDILTIDQKILAISIMDMKGKPLQLNLQSLLRTNSG